MDVAIDGRRLTTFVNNLRGPSGPTPWFPQGKLTYGSQYVLPDSLFDPQGNADLQLYYVAAKKNYGPGGSYTGPLFVDSPALQFDLPVHTDPLAPQDVYIYDIMTADPPPGAQDPNYRDAVFTTPKSVFPSSDPTKFRLRVLNLGAKAYPSVYDRISLCYADGTPVSEKLQNVAFQQATDYIELPYGNYMFRLKDQSDNFMEGSSNNGQVALNPDGTIVGHPGLGYTPIYFFQPGGVYTIVSTWDFYEPDATSGIHFDLPGYRVIKDNTPPANPNYIRIQGVDAVPGVSNLHFTVDGQPLNGFLQLGGSSAQGIFSIGPHQLQVLDGNGNLLAQQLLPNTEPLDNLTCWAFKKDGDVQLLVTSNNMGMANLGVQNSSDPTQITYITYGFTCRFLNFSDIPAVSFLDSSGNFGPYSNPDAYQHLGIGVTLAENATINIPFGIGSYAKIITAYNSPQGEVPGTPLLTADHPLLINPALYSGQTLPAAEPGVWSVALIGTSAGGLKLITIRHNL
jgi:hypothetical protein